MFLPQGIETDKDIYRAVAENVDRLITNDLPFRGVAANLYQNARGTSAKPLTFAAA